MALKSAKEIWEFLKSEYEGDERIKGMKVLNLARALGINLSDNSLVQKILVSVHERYEATITSLENTKDLSELKVIEVVSALQVQEQRILMRQEGSIEGALKAKVQQGEGGKEKKGSGSSNSESAAKDAGSTCKHCGKQNHPHFR
ncbi:uncharacterized protein LOC120075668 [Benincasa hispida]|uniref:uncharacterized protein LOC120075668 n=1 Tax=Benincasa hispida TaxID=102211 RepID=UPI0019017A77|nr:uncharacterized protein LOC120075668 [Benincasa hispida]